MVDLEYPFAGTPAAKRTRPGEFNFAAAFLDHGHIYDQTKGLIDAGGTLTAIYDSDPARAATFAARFAKLGQHADVHTTFGALLDNPRIQLIASAAVPNDRAPIGIQVLQAGKDYFTDKSPFTSLAQLEQVRSVVSRTRRKYFVYYAERLDNRPTYYACELARDGHIGKVLQVLILAPHNLASDRRPAWFFDKGAYGGILTDIGSHQFEQFLYVTSAHAAAINFARVDNLDHPDLPGLEDFGEASLTLDTGASAYCRVDWFNPKASRTWGDGRAFILGTNGYIEVRKNVDAGRPDGVPCVVMVNNEAERRIGFDGSEPLPFFARLINDCVTRGETAMTQEHAFRAAELSMQAQQVADSRRAAAT